MDGVLAYCDSQFLTPYVYPASWPEDNILRQFVSLFFLMTIGGSIVYLLPAALNYYFIYDHRLRKHPLFLKNQEWLEIHCALTSVPFMAIPTVFLFVLEIQGYSRLYDDASEYGYPFLVLSFFSFLFFTDFAIYWIHRWLHSKLLYAPLHKLHHKWKVCTPFASHAFHPIDGFLQSLPYHIYPFVFPLHKGLYLGLFLFVNIWTVSIHDADFRVPNILKPIINGSAHHTDHHLYFTVNYGEYFTIWDRLGGSFQDPTAYHGDNVLDQAINGETKNAVTQAIKREENETVDVSKKQR